MEMFAYFFTSEQADVSLMKSEGDVLAHIEKAHPEVGGVSIYNESLERMEKLIEMGFKEGLTATLGSLKELLARLSQS